MRQTYFEDSPVEAVRNENTAHPDLHDKPRNLQLYDAG